MGTLLIVATLLVSCPLSSALCLLSDAPPPQFVGNFVLTLCAIAVALAALIGVLLQARRQPPVAEEMKDALSDVKEAFRREVDDEIQRVHNRIDGTKERIDELTDTINRTQQDAERARGRLEGKLDMVIEQLKLRRPH